MANTVSLTNKTLSQIETEIAIAATHLAQLEKQKEEVNRLSPAQELAIALHDKLWNRASEDGWHYEHNWNDFAHALYLDKADKIIMILREDVCISLKHTVELAKKIVGVL